ncbi:MAG: DUF6020 family protein [Lachnospiraceae bacterium]|nr:DUF6020 family protein [Lachnospiraceae bacterium]
MTLKKIICDSMTLLMTMLSMYSINCYFFYNNTNYKNSIVNIFLFGAILLTVYQYRNRSFTRDVKRGATIYALMISSALVFGDSIYRTGSLSAVLGTFGLFFRSIVIILGFTYFIFISLALLFDILTKIDLKKYTIYAKFEKLNFLYFWLVIFLCWLPIWLAFYPGTLSYDAIGQLIVYDTKFLYNHHPILHTWFLGSIYNFGKNIFGSDEAGLVLYSIIQMLVLSSIFSLSLSRLKKFRVNQLVIVTILLFLCFFPVISAMSFIPTKDVLFGGLYAYFLVQLYEICIVNKVILVDKRKLIILTINVLALLFLRHNAIYILCLSLIPTIFLFRRYWVKISIYGGTVVLIYLLISGPGYNILGVVPVNKREMLSLPIQQIALVYKRHGAELNQEDKDAIAKLLPGKIKDIHKLRNADPIKEVLDIKVLNENNYFYWRFYWRLFLAYPMDYFDAALNLNLAYWYPDVAHPDSLSGIGYIETNIENEYYDVKRKSKLKGLYKLYEPIVEEAVLQRMPVIGFISNIGAIIWLFLFGLVLCYVKKCSKLSVLFWPALIFALTHMAGPLANLRYMVPLYMCFPFCFGLLINEKCITNEADNG